jgi:hypothetical protein
MLAAELRKEPAQLNGERIRALRQELARRGPDPALEDDAAVEAACGKFLAETSGTRPIRKRICRSFLTVAASLLLLTALFFALPKAAEANDIKNVIGWWNDSVFQFIKPGETPIEEEYVFQTDHPGLQQIYDAVADLGITVPIVPTILPKEYELVELKTLALYEDNTLWREAFENGVFITSEQNLLALLRMIQLAWSQVKQARNQQEIFDEVNKLLDRVGEFMKRYEDLGKKIESLQGSYDDTKKKLYSGNQSVVKAAEKLIDMGGKSDRLIRN